MKLTLHGESVFYSTGSARDRNLPQSAYNTANNTAEHTDNALVFLHGAGMDHTVWVMPTRYFARHGFRVIAPDLPAHGASSGSPLTSIEAYADWLRDLLDALNLSRASLIGHSMGSLIAVATAAQHPERVDKLALLGTADPMRVGAGLLHAAQDNDAAAYAMANTWSHSATGKLGRSGQPGLWNLNTGLRLMQRSRAGVFHADLAACNAFDANRLDRVVDVNALVIAGSRDQMTPATKGHAMAKRIDRVTITQLPGSGHSMLSEQPNAVLDALAGFLVD